MTATAPVQSVGTVLVVDDDELLLKACANSLRRAGLTVESVSSARDAVERTKTRRYDAIVSDVCMPDIDGDTLLRLVRSHDAHVPIVLMSGLPTLKSAIRAIEQGVVRYLEKPFGIDEFVSTVVDAVQRRRSSPSAAQELERFTEAVGTLWVAYQPIVRWSQRQTIAFEALVRCKTEHVNGPTELIELAERTNQLSVLGHLIRNRVAADASRHESDALLFVNIHPADLDDPNLYDPTAPLSQISSRVVLEITERASVTNLSGLKEHIAALRALGFRVAVDDLGAGYAGLSTIAQVNPEFVKLDGSLIRGLENSPVQQMIVEAVLDLTRSLKCEVIAEAIETADERNRLRLMGIDCMQGYYFARPSPPFIQVDESAFREARAA